MAFFTELEQIILKFVQRQIVKAILRKKNRAGGISLHDFRLYYTAQSSKQYDTGTKTNIDEQNRIESPEINLIIHGQLIYDKDGKTIQWRKDSLFNKWCWENWTATCKKKNEIKHSLKAYAKINSKWIKDLNVRQDTIILLEENIGRTHFDVNHSKHTLT